MLEKKMTIKPVAAAVGLAFASSLAVSATAAAADNPFAAADLGSGYLLAGEQTGEEGKCGEGKCGASKAEEGSCGEMKGEEGKCGEMQAEESKGEEGKCGDMKGAEGSCGEGKGEEGGADKA